MPNMISLPRTAASRAIRPLVAMALGLALTVLPQAVAPAAAAEVNHLTIARAGGASQTVTLGLNKSMIVDLPVDAHEVIVSQPSIAAATIRSKRRAVLQGMGIGDTNMFFLDDKGAQIATLEVSVMRDDSTLTGALAKLLPGSAITVQGFADRIILSGTARSQDDVAKASQIAAQFAGGAPGGDRGPTAKSRARR